MGCLVVAVWTWAAAIAALDYEPGWALLCASIAGCALGVQVTTLVYEDTDRQDRVVPRMAGTPRLEVVRRPGAAPIARPKPAIAEAGKVPARPAVPGPA